MRHLSVLKMKSNSSKSVHIFVGIFISRRLQNGFFLFKRDIIGQSLIPFSCSDEQISTLLLKFSKGWTNQDAAYAYYNFAKSPTICA